MNTIQAGQLDLDLLAVADTGSVTAAERLCLTESAISAALGCLRNMSGMALTHSNALIEHGLHDVIEIAGQYAMSDNDSLRDLSGALFVTLPERAALVRVAFGSQCEVGQSGGVFCSGSSWANPFL